MSIWQTRKLFDRISNEVPNDGSFRKRDTERLFQHMSLDMIGKGYEEDEVVETLQELYEVMCNEFVS